MNHARGIRASDPSSWFLHSHSGMFQSPGISVMGRDGACVLCRTMVCKPGDRPITPPWPLTGKVAGGTVDDAMAVTANCSPL